MFNKINGIFFSQNILARIPGISVPTGGDENPYMEGQKLPVAAKKGMFWIYNSILISWDLKKNLFCYRYYYYIYKKYQKQKNFQTDKF